ncbi:MAG: hypothetical protein V4631_23755 [Pseudomonadota bacterium]
MNIAKNMEAVFVAIIVLAGVATFATAKVVPAPVPAAQVATTEKMTTVVVSTKRLTAAEKARLGS